MAGAFGAHALKTRLEPAQMEVFQKAVFYQLVHGLALLSIPTLAVAERTKRRFIQLFIGGVLLFSGSLYIYVLTGERSWAMITPIGGSLLIITWFLLVARLLRDQPGDRSTN